VRVDRLLLVTWSPRLPAGVLSWPAWEALRSGPVWAADADSEQALAVRAAGIPMRTLDAPIQPGIGPDPAIPRAGEARELAAAFRDAARDGGTAVWLSGPDGDPAFARALGDLVAREPSTAVELEVVYGSWDPPGARLLDVVAVMDRLRSPGGCPWDAQQTHATLAPYLLEEAYELLDAIEEDDLELLREELGDVLLQVVFHSRLAEERPEDERWSVDDVAGDLVAKLVRRHPHVFADRAVSDAAEVQANWDEIKTAEKSRESVTDGVPLGQPALALAAKLQRGVDKAGLDVEPPAGDDVGARLFAVVRDALAEGVDPEAALRAAARDYRERIHAAEEARRLDGADRGADVGPAGSARV
jgi:NTP pyrophosphatase (non-canonical NTP hydrolase)